MAPTEFTWPHHGTRVFLVGCFNNWQPIPMPEKRLTLDLPPGTYDYKFNVDGEWQYDGKATSVLNPDGSRSNLLRIKAAEEKVSVYHISDTHNRYLPLDGDYDLYIHSGDFSFHGEPDEYKMFNEFLGTLRVPYRIVVLGNHDLEYLQFTLRHPDALGEAKKMLSNAIVLNCEVITLFGKKIYGNNWHWFNQWNFSRYVDERYKDQEKWEQLPENTDIFITHHPPFQVLDVDTHFCYSLGSKKTLEVIKNKRPKFHLFGHIHGGNGCHVIKWNDAEETHFVNSAIMDDSTSYIAYKPHSFSL